MAEQFRVDLTSVERTLTEELKAVPNLCKDWPVVKKVLQAILDATKNPFVKLALTIVITVGDGICGGK